MGSSNPAKTRRQPLFMQQRSTDEYFPQPYRAADHAVLRRTSAEMTAVSEATGVAARVLAGDRVGTAIGLRALNDEWGDEFYVVPEEAGRDQSIADEVFSGNETVVDVQTHFLPPGNHVLSGFLKQLYQTVMPGWWNEIDPIVSHDIAEYIMNVYLRTENTVAVLTTGVGGDPTAPTPPRQLGQPRPSSLYNDEMAAMRNLVHGMAGSKRLLNHAAIRANFPEEIDTMEQIRDDYDPVGWKVYTMGSGAAGWQLDDEQAGLPFLERAREVGVKLVCTHKGLAGFLDNGSPRDVGPAARLFPDLDFVVYHSGFEFPPGTFPEGHPLSAGAAEKSFAGNEMGEEGPYTDELAHCGVNRLLRSVEEAGLGTGCNVYAELGTTWFSLIRRPREAAHLLGKLLAHLGEDNVIWGTDSIWYGSAQPLIDAMRVFQIPDDMCEQFGYSKLTNEVKAKILGRNAARIYDIDLDDLGATAQRDDLSWGRELVRTLKANGFEGLRI